MTYVIDRQTDDRRSTVA